MRRIMTVLAAAAAAALFADEAKEGGTAEERRERMLAATGGLVRAPGPGGELLLLDLTGGRAGATVSETAALVRDVLRVAAAASAGRASGGLPLKEVRAALGRPGVAAAVAVIAEEGQPGLLVAPEDRWAVVNAAAVLGAGGAQRDVRLRKEIWRAVGLLMGAGTDGSAQCPFRPVLAPGDLDAFSGFRLTPATVAAVSAYSKAAGIAQVRQSTYRKACEEGWAPAPTSGAQRAVWDEVKAKRGQEAGGRE